ncbi:MULTISPECIES: restriction endonuclease subunit S [Parabacteroides]|jgi:type I restriction enzyme S subunit|uniref:restriction endonuclease subunit S n=1 Tax=Parabacteroides TaxID=375288 RepID=UPI000F0028F7|nr:MULTISPECIES: restriction endonuclease subunit S [Parabacteroides]RKU58120.1 restriction endonuclease subunit S [Parabacteroides sp. AF21-43]RKU86994.1 restriction endonuclease subunit S [Parabacteroides sp. AF39-10AC]
MVFTNSLSSYYEKFLATGEVKCIDEEIPFEIPKGWEWARFGNIVNHSPQVICEDNFEVAFMPMALIDAGYRSSYTFEKRYWRNVKSGFTKMQKGDIAYAKITPCFQNRKSFILGDVPSNIATATTELNVIRIYADTFARWYLLYILKSDFFIKEAKYKGTAGQQRVLSDYVKSKLLPIPPRKEQDRICDKLQEVLPIVDNYDKFQSELNSLNSTIGERLKKTILQEAIQGKLVPQISEEGTARELLEQIRQEKQKLVKEGKLRKSVLSDSVIYKGDDNKYYERINAQTVEIELPFEYPNIWSVLRLKDICQLIDGEKRNGKGICLDAKYLRGKSSATIVEKGKFVYAGDNIILVDGENSGEVFTVPQDGYMGSTFKQLWLSSAIWKPYILAFILFYKEDLRNSKRGAAIPHLNKELFYNLPIGIPPYQEQQRIAERINELSQLLK